MKRRGGVGCLREAFLIGWFSQTRLCFRELASTPKSTTFLTIAFLALFIYGLLPRPQHRILLFFPQ